MLGGHWWWSVWCMCGWHFVCSGHLVLCRVSGRESVILGAVFQVSNFINASLLLVNDCLHSLHFDVFLLHISSVAELCLM